MSPASTAPAPRSGTPEVPGPRFAIVMTVKNGRRWIETSIGSLLPELGEDGEVVVVDAASQDGTTEFLREVSRSSRLRVIVEPCSMGRGRDRGIRETRAPVVITQVDADVRYRPGVVRTAVEALSSRPRVGLLLVTGEKDLDPAGTKLYLWRREFYLATDGYPDTNVGDDIGAVREALRKGRVERLLVEHVGEDLRLADRAPGSASEPWKKGPGFLRVSRRRYTQGWTWRIYLRFLWVTRRTLPRFFAGAVLASFARLAPAP